LQGLEEEERLLEGQVKARRAAEAKAAARERDLRLRFRALTEEQVLSVFFLHFCTSKASKVSSGGGCANEDLRGAAGAAALLLLYCCFTAALLPLRSRYLCQLTSAYVRNFSTNLVPNLLNLLVI
jgi:hypothetical protein